MRTLSILTSLIILCSASIVAQVGINTDGSVTDPSAMLDVKSTSKGMLVPRMTTAERDAIINPANGLLIFCTSNNQYYSNKGTPASPSWIMVSSQWLSNGSHLYYSGGNVGIGTNNPNQKLQVAGKIVAEFGTVLDAAYRFGSGTENTGFSSPYPNSLSFVNNDVQSVNIDSEGRMLVGTGTPVESAQLELLSTSRGFLPPRMTKSQRDGITTPATGLVVFNTTTGELNVFNGTFWSNLDGTAADTWRCGQIVTDTRDGKTYTTVQIGTQCWFARNLNIGTRIDGYLNQTNNGVIHKYCYNDLESNCNIYGGLYQWDELMQYETAEGAQGLCPDGWHVPTDVEWMTLTTYLGGTSIAGGKMKEAGTVHWLSPNTGATNSSGFTGLPGGYRYSDGNFYYLHGSAEFWSSTEYSLTHAWYRKIYYDNNGVYRDYYYKTSGYSCRCLKD